MLSNSVESEWCMGMLELVMQMTLWNFFFFFFPYCNKRACGVFFAVVANWQQLLDGMGISNHRWWSGQDEELNTHSGICGFGVWKLFFCSNAIDFCLLGWSLCCSKILSWYDPLPLSSSHVLFRCNSCWPNPQPSMCLFSPSSFKTKKILTQKMDIWKSIQSFNVWSGR